MSGHLRNPIPGRGARSQCGAAAGQCAVCRRIGMLNETLPRGNNYSGEDTKDEWKSK